MSGSEQINDGSQFIMLKILSGDVLRHFEQIGVSAFPWSRIRLNGIDCHEKGQAYCKRPKQAASALVFGQEVTLQTYGLDKYGRTIADVLLPDGMNVNHELVKDGWCWWHRKYAPGDTVLVELEKSA